MKEYVFTAPVSNNATYEVAQQLENALTSGVFSVGDRLPCERDMQKQFQVGRGTIREALRVLRAKGWIETRNGAKGGTFVSEPNSSLLSENLSFLIKRGDISTCHLVEFRRYIDDAVAQLAMRHYTIEQAATFKLKSNNMLCLAQKENSNLQSLLSLDKELNILCVKMTHNPIFECLILTIHDSLGSPDKELYTDREVIKRIAQNWVDYATAIVARDLPAARIILGYHYLLLQKSMA